MEARLSKRQAGSFSRGKGKLGSETKLKRERERNEDCPAEKSKFVGAGTLDEVYSDLSFITFRLAFTSFFTNVIGTGLPIGKLTMAFVVA